MKYIFLIVVLFMPGLCAAFDDAPYNLSYDPLRDPFSDIKVVKEVAKSQNKLILLEFGGDWCVWCHRLDEFFRENKKVKNALLDVFVVMKVNVSEENANVKFTKQFSNAPGYPHFIIVDADGREVGSVGASKLEKGAAYSEPKMLEFIEYWKKKYLKT